MKINRAKLNALLRSGLRPDITTRKQLAAQLELDPTSLTRWFASTDSAGNPRYPVVPDRHVSAILNLFSLQPGDLSLSDEEFRQYCFEQAIRLHNVTTENSDDKKQEAPIHKRGLIATVVIAVLAIGVISGYFIINANQNTVEQSISARTQAEFDKGLQQLSNYHYRAAIAQFDKVSEQLFVLGIDGSTMSRQLVLNKGLALYGLGDWQRARSHYQMALSPSEDKAELAAARETADGARGAARGQIALGQVLLAYGDIQHAIEHDKQTWGENHPVMAENWLLLGQILFLRDQLGEARLWVENAQQLDRQLFGRDHPRVAEDTMMLALIALATGELSRAADLFDSALSALSDQGLNLYGNGSAQDLIHKTLQALNTAYQHSDKQALTTHLRETLQALENSLNANDPFVLKRFSLLLRQIALEQQLL